MPRRERRDDRRMNRRNLFLAAALASTWIGAATLLSQHTVLAGYAGERQRIESIGVWIEGAFPALRTECLDLLSVWAETKARATVAYGTSMSPALFAQAESALRHYARIECPTGAFLAAGAKARETSASIRRRAGFSNNGMAL